MAKQQSNKPQPPKSPKFVPVHYSELAGQTLAYAVAEVLGTVEEHYVFNDDGTITNAMEYAPQDKWEQVGPLFVEYSPAFEIHRLGGNRSFFAVLASDKVSRVVGAHGPNHAVALLRAVVVSGLDDEDNGQIPVPEQFLPSQVEALAIEKGDKQGAFAFDLDPPNSAANWAPDRSPAPASDTTLEKLQAQADITPTLLQAAGKEAASTVKGGDAKTTAQDSQKQPQEAKAGNSQAKPAGKAEDKPQDKPAAQAKPASGKPLPQGKQAQAMKEHGKPQGAK